MALLVLPWLPPSCPAADPIRTEVKARAVPNTPLQEVAPAFGPPYNIKLGGVMGRRIETLIRGDLLKLDMDAFFFSQFRKRNLKRGYTGVSQTLDGAVHFAVYAGDEEVVRWKNR